MTALIKTWLGIQQHNVIHIYYRYLSTAEISSALRPFYFSVHPDLFGQHPNQRIINENSLKQLNNFLQCVQSKRPVSPATLKFYIRKQTDKGEFKLIIVPLKPNDIRATILSILKASDLPTSYVDNIAPSIKNIASQADSKFNSSIKNDFNFTVSNMYSQKDSFNPRAMEEEIQKKNIIKRLKTWLDNNVDSARKRELAGRPIREEIEKLQKSLCERLSLQSVEWDCGWDVLHFRGCLQAFEALTKHHPHEMNFLKGKIVVFAAFTGVSLEGHVMLNSGEVRNNWLDLIKNVSNQDSVLLRIPAFEKALSIVLRNIKIVRRKFMPKVIVKEYENNLLRVTTTLNDYTSSRNYPKEWPNSLENYKIVIESESGPLMLSPTGQFIVPSSCPAILIVNFISDNIIEAKKKLAEYETNKYVEQALHKEVLDTLDLISLRKDDSITPELMIPCCKHLLQQADMLSSQLSGQRLFITTYYSVMTDGVICIPWNWK